MAKRTAAAIKKELDRVSRGPKGAMKRLKENLDLFWEAGGCREKEIEPALMKSVETLEAHARLVKPMERTLYEANLRAALSGLAKRKSKPAREFVQARLERDYGALPAVCSIFMADPEGAYDRLSPCFEQGAALLPHPVLDQSLRVLQYGTDLLERSPRPGGPRTPDWIHRDPRWTELAIRLIALLSGERDRAWKTTPFAAIDLLALSKTPAAEKALVALVGVVSVGTCFPAWSTIEQERKQLRAALAGERKRLVALAKGRDPEEAARLLELERESDPHAGNYVDDPDDLTLLNRLLQSLSS